MLTKRFGLLDWLVIALIIILVIWFISMLMKGTL
jgi:hypothetical protein